jgi:Zn-dependent protease with chaperone function
MNFAYLFRLVCLCLACFFLIQVALSLAARALVPAAIRFAGRLRARFAARLLLALRLLPTGLALLAVAVLCLPSYLWFEPEASAEKIGVICSLAALLGATLWTISFVRVLRAAAASSLRSREWRRMGESFRLPDEVPDILVIENEAPLLALSGVFHPRLIASRGVLRRLSAEQLNAALRHENAHHASRDNLKRLLLLLAPDAIPFVRSFASLERAWSRFIEWAADDRAVAGDAQRSLSLAEALVRVSRMGAPPRLSPLLSTLTGEFTNANGMGSERDLSRLSRATSKALHSLKLGHNPLGINAALRPEVADLQFHSTLLAPDDGDLSARVNRLLHPSQRPELSRSRLRILLVGAALAAAGLLTAVLLQPATSYAVHRLLEHLVR